MTKPKKAASGEHPSVKAFRKKLDSLQDGAFQDLEDLNARIDKLVKESSTPPPRDPRREPDDPRSEDDIAVDIVDLPPDAPLPRTNPPSEPGASDDDAPDSR